MRSRITSPELQRTLDRINSRQEEVGAMVIGLAAELVAVAMFIAMVGVWAGTWAGAI